MKTETSKMTERRIMNEDANSNSLLVSQKASVVLDIKDIIVVVSTAISITLSWATMSSRITLLEQRIQQYEKQFEKLENKYESLGNKVDGGVKYLTPPNNQYEKQIEKLENKYESLENKVNSGVKYLTPPNNQH